MPTLKEALLIRRSLLQKKAEDEEAGSTDVPFTKVVMFLRQNPNPTDEQWHNWAESQGYNVHAAEAVAYKLATMAADFLASGKAMKEGVSLEEFDQKQLEEGMKVEKEHSDNPLLQLRTVLDHLAENKQYYLPYLKDMEEKAKQEKAAASDEESLRTIVEAIGRGPLFQGPGIPKFRGFGDQKLRSMYKNYLDMHAQQDAHEFSEFSRSPAQFAKKVYKDPNSYLSKSPDGKTLIPPPPPQTFGEYKSQMKKMEGWLTQKSASSLPSTEKDAASKAGLTTFPSHIPFGPLDYGPGAMEPKRLTEKKFRALARSEGWDDEQIDRIVRHLTPEMEEANKQGLSPEAYRKLFTKFGAEKAYVARLFERPTA